jgi:hypothetical protein
MHATRVSAKKCKHVALALLRRRSRLGLAAALWFQFRVAEASGVLAGLTCWCGGGAQGTPQVGRRGVLVFFVRRSG